MSSYKQTRKLMPMNPSTRERATNFYVETYDLAVSDWPGEITFYREMVAEARSKGGGVLEIGCGTGRVAIRLAQDAVDVVGLDLSSQMLEVAREKSMGFQNIRWVLADMRSFELGETFALVIIPGHSFQSLNTALDQVMCLETIKRHLAPGGVLVVHLDHQDARWLGDLLREKGGRFEAAEQFRHPSTDHMVRTSRAWSYEPSTQTAVAQTIWEEFDANGQVVDRWQKQPVRLHCVFRFEMEHLFARTGFDVESVYGDFFRQALHDDSTDMVWVARSGAIT